MVFLLVPILAAVCWAAFAARRAGRLSAGQLRAVVAVSIVVTLLALSALLIERIEAA
jgi:hypothetical protein